MLAKEIRNKTPASSDLDQITPDILEPQSGKRRSTRSRDKFFIFMKRYEGSGILIKIGKRRRKMTGRFITVQTDVS